MEEHQRPMSPVVGIEPLFLTLTSVTVSPDMNIQSEPSSPELNPPKRAAVSTPDNASQPPKKRHCISMACMPCRARRSKVGQDLHLSAHWYGADT